MLDICYIGDFSFHKLKVLQKYPNIHIYSSVKWPIHNFIGTISPQEIPQILSFYNRVILFGTETLDTPASTEVIRE